MTPETPRPSPIKVLYILAWGRSGTTILDNLLGETPGFFSTGEIRFLWRRGILRGWQCGCGVPVTDCEIWSRVLTDLRRAAGPARSNAEHVLATQERFVRVRQTRTLLRLEPGGAANEPDLASYLSLLNSLYESVVRHSGRRVVVDSSKRPSDAALLRLLPAVDPYFVQVVRDPRAVAYSWSKRDTGIGIHGTAASTLSWLAWNTASAAVRRRVGASRSLVVRYEDFVADPSRTLDAIIRLVGEDPANAPRLEGGTAHLRPNHSVSGNPSRFRTGNVTIRPDDRWLLEMSRTTRMLVTTLALPLLRHYGYSLRAGKETSRGRPRD